MAAEEGSGLLKGRTRGYGAAVPSTPMNSQRRKPRTVTHTVTSSDSLSSLAIKYNSTVADIKRLNKIWNSESLSFKQTLEIPVYEESPAVGNVATPKDATRTSNGERAPGVRKSPDNSPKSSTDSATKLSDIDITLSSKPEISISDNSLDFFAKFDKSLTLIKRKVEQQAATSAEYLEDDDILYDSSLRSTSSQTSGGQKKTPSDDITLTPEPVIKSRFKKKLREHERRQNEELFEL